MGHKIRHITIQKVIHLVSIVCWCMVLLKGVKVKSYPHKCAKVKVLGIFCGCSGKTSTICHQ